MRRSAYEPMVKATLRPRVPEKAEQSHGVQLLRSIGGKVFVMGTHRRRTDFHGTMQTPGIPDVMAFLPAPRPSGVAGQPPHPWFLFWECKATGGRLRPEQAEFQTLCQNALIEHVAGNLDALIAWLVSRDYVKADSFPHDRHPRG